jgi:hypothetical protein
MLIVIVVGVLAWLVIALFVMALLTAAKRDDAAAAAAYERMTEAGVPRPTPPDAPVQRSAALDGLARTVRQELAVDQVIIVAAAERGPSRMVVAAAAGMPPEVVGERVSPRESIAAAVAVSGHAVIAPDHGPLDRPAGAAGGDAVALPLPIPSGAIAVARFGRDRPLTADDLGRLREILLRQPDLGDTPEPTQSPS